MVARIGVLALQGDVREHVELLGGLDVSVTSVKATEDLDELDGLVLPGGESTTIGLMLDEHGMLDPLRKRIEGGLPVLGTCAGAILLAREVLGGEIPKLGVLDVTIHRNAYGRQVDSFEEDVEVTGAGTLHAVFIRAPVIEGIGEGVEVLATHRDRPVVVREANILAATFHPELSHESGLHEMLVASARG